MGTFPVHGKKFRRPDHATSTVPSRTALYEQHRLVLGIRVVACHEAPEDFPTNSVLVQTGRYAMRPINSVFRRVEECTGDHEQ